VSEETYTENLPSKQLPRNRLIMLRFVEGQSVEEIAQYFDLQPGTINGILNSPLVRQEMEHLSHNAVERVASLTDEALDLVKDTMRGKVGSELRFKAANSILDRNVELNPRKSDARDLVEGLGEGMIRAIGRQLREMEKKEEPIIEISNSDVKRATVDSGSNDSKLGGEESGV